MQGVIAKLAWVDMLMCQEVCAVGTLTLNLPGCCASQKGGCKVSQMVTQAFYLDTTWYRCPSKLHTHGVHADKSTHTRVSVRSGCTVQESLLRSGSCVSSHALKRRIQGCVTLLYMSLKLQRCLIKSGLAGM